MKERRKEAVAVALFLIIKMINEKDYCYWARTTLQNSCSHKKLLMTLFTLGCPIHSCYL